MCGIILNLNLNSCGNQINFSCESMAIMSLIDYCNLRINLQIKCCCYYDSNLLDRSKLIDSLNQQYPEYTFLGEYEEENSDPNKIYVKDLNHINKLDTKLPSLIRKINENLNITITGLASVFRDIVKVSQKLKTNSNLNYLLGFRNNCLKACSEVSKWTYLCETMSIKVYDNLNDSSIRNDFLVKIDQTLNKPLELANRNRKLNKERQKIISSNQNRYMEDYLITISDLLLFFFISLIMNSSPKIKDELKKYRCIAEWYMRMLNDGQISKSFISFNKFETNIQFDLSELKTIEFSLESINLMDDFNINQSKVVEDDSYTDFLINEILMSFKNKNIQSILDKELIFQYKDIEIDWSSIDKMVSPSAGGLPSTRIKRKCEQLENMLFLLRKFLIKDNKQQKVIVDFCSGGGHLGILIAYMLPNCVIKLVENKEESLEFAIERIKALNLKNCLIYKGNLTNFVGKFDIGIGLHACGSMTDLLIEKCVKSQADVLIAPCCYGSIKENDSIKYPRSNLVSNLFLSFMSKNLLDDYYKLCSYADRTEKNIQYEQNAYECMSIIDIDRLIYLHENKYILTQLNKMKPENCTTKNNVIIAKFKE